MKYLPLAALAAILTTISKNLPAVQENTGLQLQVSNIRSAKGQMMVAVYDSKATFLGDQVVKGIITPVTRAGQMTIRIGDLPFGTYAISIFHDVNGNGKLDTNFLGIPKEPYGFSNNAKGHFGPPHYDKARFEYRVQGQTTAVKL